MLQHNFQASEQVLNRQSGKKLPDNPSSLPQLIQFAPYQRIEFYLVGLIFGVVGTSVMAVVNGRRTRQQHGLGIVVIVALFIFIGRIVEPMVLVAIDGWSIIASILFAIGVFEWQKRSYPLWQQSYGTQTATWAERGGWPLFILILVITAILYFIFEATVPLLRQFALHADFTAVMVLGFLVIILAPMVYDLFTRHPLQLKQMFFYTAGWVVSLPFSALWIFFGLLAAGDGRSGRGDIRDTMLSILAGSSCTFLPVVIASLIISWISFQSNNYRLARLFMLLPLINVILYATMINLT